MTVMSKPAAESESSVEGPTVDIVPEGDLVFPDAITGDGADDKSGLGRHHEATWRQEAITSTDNQGC